MTDRYGVVPRSVLGKRTKRLRWEGILPGNVYGRGIESLAVQLPRRDAEAMLAEHGLNSLIEIAVDGEGEQRSVVVRGVQRHPLSRQIQHIDFFQVDLTRPIQAMVPVTIVGEAPAVHTHQGILITGADHVLTQALPAEMPQHFEISVESLEELEQQLTVADLQTPAAVEVLADPEIMLVRVARPRLIEEVEEEVGLLEGEEGIPEEGEAAEGEEPEEGAAPEDERSSR